MAIAVSNPRDNSSRENEGEEFVSILSETFVPGPAEQQVRVGKEEKSKGKKNILKRFYEKRISSRRLLTSLSSSRRESLSCNTVSTEASSCNDDGESASDNSAKKVKFSRATYHLITSYKEYTDKEKISCWYQKDEYTQILKECKQEFREAKGESIPRGLEGFGKSDIYSRRFQEKKKSIHAVLSEQGLQWISGKFDEEAIATRYCSFTRASKWNALQVAFDDRECIS